MSTSRPATLRAVRARHRPFEISAEYLKIHHGVQPFQGITLGREFLQPLLNIEKPWLTPHPPPPSRTRPIESRTGQNCQVLGGLQFTLVIGRQDEVKMYPERLSYLARINQEEGIHVLTYD